MSGIVGAIAEVLTFWARRARSRRRLAELNGRMLDDIGIKPADARREIRKFPWQA